MVSTSVSSPNLAVALRAGTVGATLLAVLLLLRCYSPSTFISAVWPPRLAQGTEYADQREQKSISGFPVRAIQAELDARLPADVPITLAPELRSNMLLYQRLAEQLYPRKLAANAPHVVGYDAVGAGSVALARWGGRTVALKGPAASSKVGANGARTTGPLEFSWWRFALCMLGVLGWGGAVATYVNRVFGQARGLTGFGASAVYAAAFFGTLASAATWLQVPLPFEILTLSGLVAGYWSIDHGGGVEAWIAGLGGRLRYWENWVLAAAGVLFWLFIARTPVTGWDGRSIWLFHAKQLSGAGFFSAVDRWNPEYWFSHVDYPLLFPAWLAQFSSLEPAYDERMASLGIPVMFFGVIGAVWSISRHVLGRWPGSFCTFALVLSMAPLATGGYVDSYLALLLLVFLLGLLMGDEPLAWTAALAASLTKREGLPLAMAVALVYLLTHQRVRGVPLRRRALRLLALAPAVVDTVWAHFANIPDAYASGAMHSTEVVASRLPTIVAAIPGLTSEHFLLVAGYEGAVLSLVLLVLLRRDYGWGGLAALTLAMAFAGFAVYSMAITPFDLSWHISTALGRLLLHASAMAMVAPLLILERADCTDYRRGRKLGWDRLSRTGLKRPPESR